MTALRLSVWRSLPDEHFFVTRSSRWRPVSQEDSAPTRPGSSIARQMLGGPDLESYERGTLGQTFKLRPLRSAAQGVTFQSITLGYSRKISVTCSRARSIRKPPVDQFGRGRRTLYPIPSSLRSLKSRYSSVWRLVARGYIRDSDLLHAHCLRAHRKCDRPPFAR
jgi:hypothetical protein